MKCRNQNINGRSKKKKGWKERKKEKTKERRKTYARGCRRDVHVDEKERRRNELAGE